MPTAASTRAAGPRLQDTARVIARDPLLLAATIAMVVSGLAASAMAPQLSLFLTETLGTSLRLAGFYYLTSLTAPVVGFLVGAASDRRGGVGRRLGWFAVCGVLNAAGWFVTAAALAVWVAFAASTVFLAFGGASSGQLFAAVRDHLTVREKSALRPLDPGTSTQVIALVRMAMTAGWIVGPLIGSWAGGVWGLRAVLVGSGVACLVQVCCLLLPGRRAAAEHAEALSPAAATTPQLKAPTGSVAAMLAFILLCVITLAGNTMKYAFLPIHMEEVLHISDTVRGAVIGSQQLVELALMPAAAVAAARWQPLRVVTCGAAAAVAAHLCFVLGGTVAWLFIGQALLGVMWAAIAGVGLQTALQLAGGRHVGVTAGLFMSQGALASALGGLIGGAAVGWLGLPGVFAAPATLTAVAVVGLLALTRATRTLMG